MWHPASGPWHGQHPRHVVTREHNEGAPYRRTGFMDTTPSPSTNYGSGSQQSVLIPRRDPARNQRPGSPFFGPLQFNGSQVQNYPHRGSEAVAYRATMVAPGGHPSGHQKPGVIAMPNPRHFTHYQNRSIRPYLSHTVLRQQDARHQRENFDPNTSHQCPRVPGQSTPPMTGDPVLDWQSQATASPQGPLMNSGVSPTLIDGAMVMASETNLPPWGFAQGAPPATVAPTLSPEAPPTPSTTGSCPAPSCKSKHGWGRQQELERHVLMHLPQHFYCPHQSCGWRSSRRYALKNHYEKKHQIHHAQEAPTIYDASSLAKRLVNREVTLKQAIDEAEASVWKKGVELGKWDLWNMRYK